MNGWRENKQRHETQQKVPTWQGAMNAERLQTGAVTFVFSPSPGALRRCPKKRQSSQVSLQDAPIQSNQLDETMNTWHKQTHATQQSYLHSREPSMQKGFRLGRSRFVFSPSPGALRRCPKKRQSSQSISARCTTTIKLRP